MTFKFVAIFNPTGAGDVKPIFAVPLATAVDRSKSHDGVPLPIVVRETIDYIEEFGTLMNYVQIVCVNTKKMDLINQVLEPIYPYRKKPPVLSAGNLTF